MSKRRIYTSVIVVQIILSLQFQSGFSQDNGERTAQNSDPDSPVTVVNESIAHAVKNAIRELDEEKEKKHAELIRELKSELNTIAQEWILSSKRSKEAELGQFQHTDWDLTGLVFYPVPYDYYLRGFDYSITKIDLIPDSLSSKYNASLNISEKLYVEGVHSSQTTDIRQYYYTLTRIIVLSLENKQNKFIITNTEYGPYHIAHDWQKN
jgi:hypothetical protein